MVFESGMTDCHNHMTGQGYDEESAWAICQSLKQKLSSVVTTATTTGEKEGEEVIINLTTSKGSKNDNSVRVLTHNAANDKLYMKLFLIDSSLNKNHWGVNPSTIDRNIRTAIGKPVILYKNTGAENDRLPEQRPQGQFDHPPTNDNNIDHILQSQEPYSIGTFIDVVKDEHGAWWGIAEITDKKVKQAILDDPNRPFYLSPSIIMTHPYQQDQDISDWIFVHSAMVDHPAFGVTKAYSRGHCSGAADQCLLQLRRASSIDNDNDNDNDNTNSSSSTSSCGFCTYEAMNQIAENARVSGAAAADDDMLVITAALPAHSADRPDSHFAYVPEEAKGQDGKKSLRKFPIFDRNHAANALARFSQADLPRNKRGEVLDRICRAAKKFDIESEVCKERADTGKIPAAAESSLLLIENASLTLEAARQKKAQNEPEQVVWLTRGDERVCPICEPLEGQLYNLNNPQMPVPIDDTHPNCRCLLIRAEAIVKPSSLIIENTALTPDKQLISENNANSFSSQVANTVKKQTVEDLSAQSLAESANENKFSVAGTDNNDSVVATARPQQQQQQQQTNNVAVPPTNNNSNSNRGVESSNDTEKSNTSTTTTISKVKLAKMIAEREFAKQKSAHLESKLASTQKQLNVMEGINEKNATRLASLEQWQKNQVERERYQRIGGIIESSSVYAGLSDEEKEEQLRQLAATGWTPEEIIKHLDPLNKVAEKRLEQTSSSSSNNDNDNDDNKVLPFGSNTNNNNTNQQQQQTAAAVKTASVLDETEQTGPRKVPRAIMEAQALLGNEGVEY